MYSAVSLSVCAQRLSVTCIGLSKSKSVNTLWLSRLEREESSSQEGRNRELLLPVP